MSVPIVSLPVVRVASVPGAQAAAEDDAEALVVALSSSTGEHAVTVASRSAAPPTATGVNRLTMPGSLEDCPTGWGRSWSRRDELQESCPVKTFEELFAELQSKAAEQTPGSGTVEALQRGVHFIGKKVVEEAAESWMAAEHEGPERAAEEISQLLYQAQVLMIATGLELKDVYRHL
ncbi:hypothetical protein Acsp01_79050 [Actinoplanes sp. NBRC 101535]|nr:hypothetical protein Acsp01_79050 [Actinoplanes sp. NBRC 101535]